MNIIMLSTCFAPLFVVYQMPMVGHHSEVAILFMTLLNSFILLSLIYITVTKLYTVDQRQKKDFSNISSHVELMRDNLKKEVLYLNTLANSVKDVQSQENVDINGYYTAVQDAINRLDMIQNNLETLAYSSREGNLPIGYSVILTPDFRMNDFVSQPVTTISASQSEPMSGELFIEKLNQHIEQNLSNPDFSVNTLAQELCVSRSSLFAKVKDATGETPNNLLVKARLNAAAKLLEKKEKAVNEICYMVGFSSPSYFSRCFVKYYGVTPHEWANKNKNQ